MLVVENIIIAEALLHLVQLIGAHGIKIISLQLLFKVGSIWELTQVKDGASQVVMQQHRISLIVTEVCFTSLLQSIHFLFVIPPCRDVVLITFGIVDTTHFSFK